MNHQQIEQLAKQWIVDAADRPANPRVQAIVLRLVTDLCKAIEDLDIQPSEFWTGLDFLTNAGKNNELGLLTPGLGLERFMDIRADEAEARAGIEGGTPRTIEGPLYVAGAPVEQGFARLDDGTESDKGDILFMQGTVFDGNGKPMPGAQVEVWHANLQGNYSFFDQSQSPFNLRRTIVTDAEGRYGFQSIVPKGYGAPPGGSTHTLLEALGRHGQRPAHIHFFVTAPGQRKLTTQINIDGDEYLWDDFAFASREGLVPPVTRVEDPAAIAARGVNKPFMSIDFDFHLHNEVADAPSAVVERPRAAA